MFTSSIVLEDLLRMDLSAGHCYRPCNKQNQKNRPNSISENVPEIHLLLTLLFTALFNINLAGLLDPMAILIRALTFFIYLFSDIPREAAGLASTRCWATRRQHRTCLSFSPGLYLSFRETLHPLAFAHFRFSFILFL